MGYVIDSNTVIDYLSGQIPLAGMSFIDEIINDFYIVSIMTKIEVLGYNNLPEVETLLNQFIEYSLVVPLTEDVVQTTIKIRKFNKIKTPDAIIASTALVLNHPLITRNVSDFKKVNNLKVVNPWLI